MKKKDKNNLELIPGQVSIFDIQIIEKTKKVTEVEVSFTESRDFAIENKQSFTNAAVEVTEKQQKVIDKFKASQVVSRVILYAKGSIGIETKESEGFKTHYINREGKEECSINAKSPVLPWDKIIYYMQGKVPFTKEQVDKLQTLLSKHRYDVKRVLHRKGDENLLIETSGKIISLLPNGWQIEFESIEHIDCEETEIYLIPTKIAKEETKKSKELHRAKVGDYVQAMYGKELIEGTIVREYGLGNEILNIVFAEGTKHTAIGRMAVKKILKSA